MRRVLPKHLSGFACVALIIGCASSLPALSCQLARPSPTDKELFDNANEVFVGRVLSTELTSFPKKVCEAEELDRELCQYVKVRVEVVDVLKGKKQKHKSIADLPPSPGNCGLAVLTGLYYVFYPVSEYNVVLHPAGSFFLGYQIEKREREIISTLKEPDHLRPADEG